MVALALAAICSTTVRADAELTWAVVDWPPAFLLPKGQVPASVAELGEGQFDALFKELAKRMPGYLHRPELVNSARLWRKLGSGHAICAGALRKSAERLESAYFTPAVLLAPVSLVVRTSEAGAYLGADGRASMAELNSKSGLRGGLEAARSYGAALDALLAGPQALPRDTTSRVGQLTELVAIGRYDFTLEYAHVVEYLQRTGRTKVELSSLPLKEADEWETGYMVCPRTPWGLAAVTAIDKAIRQACAAASFREAYLRWLPPSMRQPRQAAMDAFCDARAQGGVQIE
ncbi:hypothetical protein [Paucibacter soli]|uniref:hypothetical protein n=1 Tax=Paucibacter soli TaxID=3133433 RepID=UPI0030A580FF